jgi:putative methyltransferase (TIGR04325 family)
LHIYLGPEGYGGAAPAPSCGFGGQRLSLARTASRAVAANIGYFVERLLKSIALATLPAPALNVLRRIYRRRSMELVTVKLEGETVRNLEWEMVPDEDGAWEGTAGWCHNSIALRQVEKWDAFIDSLLRAQPLGRSHEAAPDAPIDVSSHNTIMTFAYVLGRIASCRKDASPSVLDWGGGIGHYYQYARALYPSTAWDYSVKDLQALCEAGASRNLGAKFISKDAIVFSRDYDLVFASSSLHYTRDIYGLTERLCSAAASYLMVTRMPFVEKHDDFVVVQRPHRYGYHTEYAGWFTNRSRFQRFVEERGFVLEREFLLAERPFVPNAPEQCLYRGFLFRRVAGKPNQGAG